MTSASFPDLNGKSVFISGGGSGIGAALTGGFLAQGARVAFCQRSDASVFVDQMEAQYGTRPLFLPCDVTDIAAYKSGLAQAAEANGDIQVLVNNAAWDNRHRLEDLDAQAWDHMMNVNLRHHYFAIQTVAPAMKAAGAGAIINYSSISYMMGLGDYAAYVSAKSAINGLTRGLARELGPSGIRVNAMMPGWVFTDRQEELWATPDGVAAHLARQCLNTYKIPPEDMVAPTLFLASDASRAMTGQALVVDAGVVVSG